MTFLVKLGVYEMEVTLFSILSFGFFLGIKHAVEPDHVIAVSTIASQSSTMKRATLLGVFWGIGHTATLFIVGMILILIKGSISDKWAMSLEFLVGMMLVYLGLISFHSYRNMNSNQHKHLIKKVSFTKSMVIGFIHGLAGSASMVVLTMSTVTHLWEGAIYILVFGSGTVMGMLLFSTILGIPFKLSAKHKGIHLFLIKTTGVISAVFGLYYMYNLGVTEGLFRLWLL